MMALRLELLINLMASQFKIRVGWTNNGNSDNGAKVSIFFDNNFAATGAGFESASVTKNTASTMQLVSNSVNRPALDVVARA